MNTKKNLVLLAALAAISLMASGCAKEAPDDEIAQNIGDQMAALDEGGGSSGTYSFNEAIGARRPAHFRQAAAQ